MDAEWERFAAEVERLTRASNAAQEERNQLDVRIVDAQKRIEKLKTERMRTEALITNLWEQKQVRKSYHHTSYVAWPSWQIDSTDVFSAESIESC
jgi:predicted  nucleic acid-binding Zn-ribbon protein